MVLKKIFFFFPEFMEFMYMNYKKKEKEKTNQNTTYTAPHSIQHTPKIHN